MSSASAIIGTDSTATISGGNWTNTGSLTVSNPNSKLTINGGLLTVGGTISRGAAGNISLNAGGTLSFVGADGKLAHDLAYNGTLVFNNTIDYSYESILSGSGSLIKEGGTTLTFKKQNAYTGNTTISAGVLYFFIKDNGSISSSSNIINNALLDVQTNSGFIQTYGGQISGSGALTKRQSGTLVLSGNNTYTGQTQILGGGTLQIGAGGASGSLVSNVSGGSLIFNRSDSSTYVGVFSGSTLTKLGAGTLTLAGNNTNSGTTTISAGTLQIGAGGPSGSLGSNIINNANLAFNRSDNISFSRAISGTGNLTQLGAGNLTLTGSNSYTGSTTVGGTGTLRVQGSIAPSSGLTVNSGATLAGNGTISGTTINAGGILAPSNAGSSALAITGGSGSLTLASGSISNFSIVGGNSDRVTASGSISLDGVLNLAFSGDSYLTSAPYTLFSGESLGGTFSNVSVSGLSSSYLYSLNYAANALNLSLTANVLAGQSIDISTTTAATLSGGAILINEPGSSNISLVLATPTGSATNTIDGNGLTAVLSGPITGTGPLTFTNSQNSTTISNTILSGNNTYTGATVVDGGARLSVDGSIASSAHLTVNAGAIVGGNGSLPATTLQSGGYLAPGNSIGLLTAASLDFGPVAPGGILAAEIQGPQNDKTTVTGSVTNFTGSANLIPFGGGTPWPNFDYQLITAANTFASSSSLTLTPVGITSALLLKGTTLVQEADGNGQTFDVMWRPNNGSGATASAMQALGQGNRNQLAASGVFDSAFRRLASAAGDASGLTTGLNATGSAIGSTGFTTGQAAAAGLSPEFLSTTAQLLGISSNSQLTAAISTITPEPYAAFQSVGLETLQRQRQQLLASAGQCASTGWVINAPTSKTAKAPKNPICLYGQAANANSSITGQEGLSGYNASLFSSFYGLEVKANPYWRFGAAYGYGTSNLNGLGPTNAWVTATVNSGSLYGVYTPTTTSPWTFKGLLGYGNYALNGSRQVAVIGSGTPITGSTTANGLTAALTAEVAIPLTKPSAPVPVLLKPLIGLAYGNYQQAGFSETGGGPLNLNVDGSSASSLIGTIGLELTSAPIPLNKAKTISLVPKLALAYQVDALAGELGNSSLSASMPASGSGSFLTQGQNRGVNGFSIAAGADLALGQSTALYANVNYEAFSSGNQVGYGGGLRFKF